MRSIVHRFVSYTKRIGRYTIKVEWLDGQWHCWIFGPTVPTNGRAETLKGETKKLWGFYAARAYGMRFVREHSKSNSHIVI